MSNNEQKRRQTTKAARHEPKVISVFATIHPDHYSDRDMAEIVQALAGKEHERSLKKKLR